MQKSSWDIVAVAAADISTQIIMFFSTHIKGQLWVGNFFSIEMNNKGPLNGL